MQIAQEKQEDKDRPAWKKKGETAVDARDRLKRERLEAEKLRESLVGADVHN